jgi:pseudouridine-5'-phosphate glycosidase
MDLQTRKISFVQEFLKIQSEEVIDRMEKALKREKKNISGTVVKPMTLKELNKRVDQSLLDSENDKLTENNDLTNEIQEWV